MKIKINSSSIESISIILKSLSRKAKLSLLYASFLILFSAIFEVLVIYYLQLIIESFSVESNSLRVGNLSNIFIFFIVLIFSTVLNSFTLFKTGRISSSIGSEWSDKCFKNIFTKSYDYGHSNKIDSTINLLVIDLGLGVISISSFLNAVAYSLISIAIVIYLLLQEPIILSVTIISIILSYSLCLISTRSILQKMSLNVQKGKKRLIDRINNTIKYYPYINLEDSIDEVLKKYLKDDIIVWRQSQDMKFYAQTPRNIAEFVGLSIILIFLFFLFDGSNQQASSLARIGIIVAGLQRILPAINKIYYAWSTLASYKASLTKIDEIINQSNQTNINIDKEVFLNNSSHLSFQNVWFISKDNQNILKNVSIDLPLHGSMAITGPSGSGKTTLLLIASGLYQPNKGEIKINNFLEKNLNQNISNNHLWRNQISLVMQNIYYENGIIIDLFKNKNNPKPDFEKIYECLRKVDMLDKIKSLEKNVYSNLSDPDCKFSGGQLQRLTIARALYQDKKVILLDEPTSALDKKTKNLLINNLMSLKDKVIWIVTHDEKIVDKCNYHLIVNKNLKLKKNIEAS